MPLVSPRNSRYIIVIVTFLVLTFFYFHQHDLPSPETFSPPLSGTGRPSHSDLPGRIANSERKYQKVLEQRQGLIRKHGPSPSQVVMFPPDQDPWPAYTAWDFFPPAFQCPHEVERIGALGDGGKWICGLSRLEHKSDCIIYAFGVDWDSSWEAEVLSRTQHCQIWGYDATHSKFGSTIMSSLSRRTHFSKYQLGPKDSHGPDDDPKVYTLETLMKLNGHTHIDILKVDIEGWEFDTLRAMLSPYLESGAPLPFGQLQIEVHAWKQRFHDFLSWWELIEGVGLRPFMSEPNLVYVNYNRQSGAELADYSFINIKGDNVFISDSRLSPSSSRQSQHEHEADEMEFDADVRREVPQ